jgi:quercetin dioxygenase-like cupin family protein
VTEAMTHHESFVSQALLRPNTQAVIDAAGISVDDAGAATTYLEAQVSTLQKVSWKVIELEQLNDKISRQMISGDNATLSQLLLKKGAVVPRHSHVNEQYSWIMSGALKFIFDDREILVAAGEVLLIPANIPHSAVAMEDTVDVDFFAPRREDWIKKEDSYLRG